MKAPKALLRLLLFASCMLQNPFQASNSYHTASPKNGMAIYNDVLPSFSEEMENRLCCSYSSFLRGDLPGAPLALMCDSLRLMT